MANQDTGALIVAIRSLILKPELFQRVYSCLPWREKITPEQAGDAVKKYDSLSMTDAQGIFEMWRSHAFATKGNPERQQSVNVA
jgi:hypothetical protein